MFGIDKSNRILGIIDLISNPFDEDDIKVEFARVNNSLEVISIEKILEWELRRARETLPALRGLDIAIENDIETCETQEKVLKELHLAQIKLLDVPNLKQEFYWQTSFSHYVTLGMNIFSSGFSNTSSIKIRFPYCDTEKFFQWILKIHQTRNLEDKAYCLIACPDHYLIQTNELTKQICVAEVTGGASLVSYYQISLNDTSGITTPTDENYPFQLFGTFYADDGTRMGGMRYQFRSVMETVENEGSEKESSSRPFEYCEAWLSVNFPNSFSSYLIEGHQYHLACEWLRWFQMFRILHENHKT